MSDPIDWAAFGMPEGVRVERGTDGAWIAQAKWAELGLCYRKDPRGCTIWQEFGAGIHTADFPIVEAFIRAARAIEAGEVKLEDCDHA